MSYILDALKKAESERKLGSVPNVYMDPLPMAKSEAMNFPQRRTWWWIAAALLAASGAAAVWIKGSQSTMPPVAPPLVATQAAVALPVSEESSTPAEAKPETSRSESPSMKKEVRSPPTQIAKKTASAATPEQPARPIKRPAKESKQQLAKSGVELSSEKRIESNTAPVTLSRATLPAPVAAAEPERSAANVPIVALGDLPEHIRRSIPQISIGGYIYSAKPAERSMLLNNRLVREGEQVASGLILETMMAKEAVLSYQGQRFRVPYQTY